MQRCTERRNEIPDEQKRDRGPHMRSFRMLQSQLFNVARRKTRNGSSTRWKRKKRREGRTQGLRDAEEIGKRKMLLEPCVGMTNLNSADHACVRARTVLTIPWARYILFNFGVFRNGLGDYSIALIVSLSAGRSLGALLFGSRAAAITGLARPQAAPELGESRYTSRACTKHVRPLAQRTTKDHALTTGYARYSATISAHGCSHSAPHAWARTPSRRSGR